nr:hypothetical protein [Gracilaria vermiculophylla]
MKSLLPFELPQSIIKQKTVKIIVGLNNFSIYSVIKITKAAELGKASFIDIAANTEILSIVKSITNIPVCVSSIDPLDLFSCATKEADMVEIGNFDVFYHKKIFLSAKQILNLAQETKNLIHNIPISVTIPHTFLLSEQINLAFLLEKIGMSTIQSEGYSTKKNRPFDTNIKRSSIIDSINYASSAVADSFSIIGIGSVLSNYYSIYDMVLYIYEIVFFMQSSSKALIISPHIFDINHLKVCQTYI